MDRARAAYLQEYFGVDWKNPHLYDMMVSSNLGEEPVAWQIVGGVKTATLDRWEWNKENIPEASLLSGID